MAKETFKIETTNPNHIIAAERLYLTADRKTIVREGDKLAALLFAPVGHSIPIKVAQQYGLVDAPESKESKESKTLTTKGVEPEHRSTRPAEATHKR